MNTPSEHLVQNAETAAHDKIDEWCAKSKNNCACCGASFADILEAAKQSNADIICTYLDFSHPKKKILTFRLCVDCSQELKLI